MFARVYARKGALVFRQPCLGVGKVPLQRNNTHIHMCKRGHSGAAMTQRGLGLGLYLFSATPMQGTIGGNLPE